MSEKDRYRWSIHRILDKLDIEMGEIRACMKEMDRILQSLEIEKVQLENAYCNLESIEKETDGNEI